MTASAEDDIGPGPWRIRRHGGGPNHEWQTVFSTVSEEAARSRWRALLSRMRRGSLALFDPTGEPVLRFRADRR